MQPIVEFTEYPDYEAYRRFCYFSYRRRFAGWINWLSAYVIFPVWTIFLTVLRLRNPWSGRSGILLLLCFAAFGCLMFVYVASAPRRAFSRYRKSHITSRTIFFEDYYAHVTIAQSGTHEGSLHYEDIVKAYETASAFYVIHTNKSWGFFPKKFFAPGQVEALRALFARKFGERFKSKI